MENKNKENLIKKVQQSEEETEKEKEENEEELKMLQESDAAKGDLHSTDESDIPLGVGKSEYIESFHPTKKEEDEKYFDTGIRPRVKLPPDESDEWPLIIPNPSEQEGKKSADEEKNKDEKEGNKENKE